MQTYFQIGMHWILIWLETQSLGPQLLKSPLTCSKYCKKFIFCKYIFGKGSFPCLNLQVIYQFFNGISSRITLIVCSLTTKIVIPYLDLLLNPFKFEKQKKTLLILKYLKFRHSFILIWKRTGVEIQFMWPMKGKKIDKLKFYL